MLAGTFASFWPVYSAEIQEKQGALKGTWGAEHGYHGSKSMNKSLQDGAPQVMYKMVYKPHEAVWYIYHKAKLLELETNLANHEAPPCMI